MQQAVHLMPGAVEGVIAELQRLLGAQHVITDRTEREFYSQDVYRAGELPAAVIRPGSTEELAAALKAIAPSGLPIVPRGGGMSYTDGYLPKRADSIMVDMLRMNRVLEINAEDCYVTVECGATWKELCDALEPHGVRTPYYGPLSGLRSSISASNKLPGSVASDLKALAAQCVEVGGQARTADAVKRADLNGDGHEDFVLDVGSINCDGAASLYGDRDKGVTVYVGDGQGGAKNVFTDSVYGARIEGTGPAAKLWLTVSGTQCGKKPATDFASENFCDRSLIWNAKAQKFDYAPVSTVKMIQ